VEVSDHLSPPIALSAAAGEDHSTDSTFGAAKKSRQPNKPAGLDMVDAWSSREKATKLGAVTAIALNRGTENPSGIWHFKLTSFNHLAVAVWWY
jgi:hypothetical protein